MLRDVSRGPWKKNGALHSASCPKIQTNSKTRALGVVAPSVVTMNAISCAHAVDDFLFHLTGLKYDNAETGWFRWNSRRAVAGYDMPRRGVGCVECSQTANSRFGMGDNGTLPTKPIVN